ncbi:MAG: phenylalanine--tRNA ligase subunit beta [Acidobacteria bacterium]|nr:phenylalanine--tRNA ligase subunit beta [Acidobacteriota bacterium]
MKILLSWLKEFVPLPADVRRLAHDLTMLGLAVDAIATEDGETVLDLDITTNRSDCLSHYGVARELSALYGKPLAAFGNAGTRKSRARRKESPGKVVVKAVVKIAARDLCRRYAARLIHGVEVGASPAWLARRLELVGIRSVNNVADATNYVLMEYGHPLHAFDMDRLEGGKIIVRRAASGELLTTLDGVQRRLTTEDLVIADARRPVALAGVMGGKDTEISARTTNILLESAWFEPVSVRRTSKRQGLRSEASYRFERGADIDAAVLAANRCAKLIQDLAGDAKVDPQVIDVYPRKRTSKPIVLRRAELERHLGMEPPASAVKKILSRLGFSPSAKGQKGWSCTAPAYRLDVEREIDLIEEVARQYGYDKFPSRLPAMAGQAARKTPHASKQERVRRRVLELGYDETISSTLTNHAAETFGSATPVPIANPLSEEGCILRPSLIPGLLAALQWNLNRGRETVRLFEVGSIYCREADSYREPLMLALAGTGDRFEACLKQDGGRLAGKSFEILDLKGDLEQLIELFENSSYRIDSEHVPDYYRPDRSARLVMEGQAVGWFGELNSEVAARWKFRQPVYLGELSLDLLYTRNLHFPSAQAISRYPAVERDFSIVLPEGMRFESVREAIVSLGIPELVAVTPVEIFRGAPVPPGKYSLLLRLILQSQNSTLTEAELTGHSARVIDCLERKLGAQIRM